MTSILKTVRYPGEAGLVGTLGYTIFNSDGSVATALTKVGIAACTGYSDTYIAAIPLPGSGQYGLIWDDGSGNIIIDSLIVSGSSSLGLTSIIDGALTLQDVLTVLLSVAVGNANNSFSAPALTTTYLRQDNSTTAYIETTTFAAGVTPPVTARTGVAGVLP